MGETEGRSEEKRLIVTHFVWMVAPIDSTTRGQPALLDRRLFPDIA
ncbi:MAG: hypothetical protein WBG54_04160 [Acidobacteriaceae bacterium]